MNAIFYNISNSTSISCFLSNVTVILHFPISGRYGNNYLVEINVRVQSQSQISCRRNFNVILIYCNWNTFSPCLTRFRAIAAPIPALAPVTTATFPFHRSILLQWDLRRNCGPEALDNAIAFTSSSHQYGEKGGQTSNKGMKFDSLCNWSLPGLD